VLVSLRCRSVPCPFGAASASGLHVAGHPLSFRLATSGVHGTTWSRGRRGSRASSQAKRENGGGERPDDASHEVTSIP